MISLSFTLDDRRYILGATGLAHILDTGVARDVTNPYPVLLEYVHELLARRPEQPQRARETEAVAVERGALPIQLVMALGNLANTEFGEGFQGAALGVKRVWRDLDGKLPTVAEVRDEAVEVVAAYCAIDSVWACNHIREAHASGEIFGDHEEAPTEKDKLLDRTFGAYLRGEGRKGAPAEQPTADLEAQNMAVEIHTSEDFMGDVARRVREAEARPSLTEECPGARISRLEASQAEQKWRIDGLEEDANSLWHRIDKHRQMIDKLMARGEAMENRLAQLWAVKEEGP